MNRGRYYYYGVRIEGRGAKYGIGSGSALAITISYAANHSILWAIIDGILGWLYVIYFALFRGLPTTESRTASVIASISSSILERLCELHSCFRLQLSEFSKLTQTVWKPALKIALRDYVGA